MTEALHLPKTEYDVIEVRDHDNHLPQPTRVKEANE